MGMRGTRGMGGGGRCELDLPLFRGRSGKFGGVFLFFGLVVWWCLVGGWWLDMEGGLVLMLSLVGGIVLFGGVY